MSTLIAIPEGPHTVNSNKERNIHGHFSNSSDKYNWSIIRKDFGATAETSTPGLSNEMPSQNVSTAFDRGTVPMKPILKPRSVASTGDLLAIPSTRKAVRHPRAVIRSASQTSMRQIPRYREASKERPSSGSSTPKGSIKEFSWDIPPIPPIPDHIKARGSRATASLHSKSSIKRPIGDLSTAPNSRVFPRDVQAAAYTSSNQSTKTASNSTRFHAVPTTAHQPHGEDQPARTPQMRSPVTTAAACQNQVNYQPQPVSQMEAKSAVQTVTVAAVHNTEAKNPGFFEQVCSFFLCRPCFADKGCCGKNGCIAACDCGGCCCACC